MANLTNKYLDFGGLESFWNKAKTYIANEILDIDGTKILLNNDDNDSHSITYEISEIWKVLGGDAPGEGSGNLSQDVSTILGAYVKSFKGVDGEYIKIGPPTKSNGPSDIVLTLDETVLKQKLSEIEGKSGVSSFTATGSNGIAVTGAVDKAAGDVSITIDGTDLKNYADQAEADANSYTDGQLGAYTDGETPATGIRGEIETIDKRLTQSINAEITARKAKDYLLAGDNWDSDNGTWKADSTPKYSNITSLSTLIDEHEGKITALISATQFKGVDNTVDTDVEVNYEVYKAGDIVVNGPQEFIADLTVEDGGTGKWILLGDVTAEAGAIGNMITWMNSRSISKGLIQSLFVEEPEQTTISFSVNGYSYTAISGMTWEEWINSDPGRIIFVVHNGVVKQETTPVCNSADSSDVVKGSDEIIPGHNYVMFDRPDE